MTRELVAGAKAPAFTLQRDGGGKVSLRDSKGRNLVLYFYPRADTPGCTKEAVAFSRLRSEFAKTGTAILGVSADPVGAQDKFKSKHKLAIPLGSDETKKMLAAYGAANLWASCARPSSLTRPAASSGSGRRYGYRDMPTRS